MFYYICIIKHIGGSGNLPSLPTYVTWKVDSYFLGVSFFLEINFKWYRVSGFEFTFTCWQFGRLNKKVWGFNFHKTGQLIITQEPFLGWRVRQLIMAESFFLTSDHLRLIPLAPEIYRVSGRSSIGGGCLDGWILFFGGKNHQVMKAHGKIPVISGTVSLADLWSFLILSENTRQIHDANITTLRSNLVVLFLSCQRFVSLLSHLFLTHYCMCKIRLSSWSTKLSKFLQTSCELHPWNKCIYIYI